jgi:hypothetical protein
MSIIITIIGVVCLWTLISRGFRLGERVTASSEATTQLLMLAAPQEVRDKYVAMKEAEAEKLRRRKQEKFWLGIVLAVIALFYLVSQSHAQGIYMGRDGRVHSQVIVGPDGAAFPVAPTFCTPGFGPCPVVLGAPLPPALPPAPPPVEAAPPAPPPLGWVFTRYTVCPEPAVCPVVFVSVGADGLNVRATPNGPPILSLVNGTPLGVITRTGQWTLVAPVCNLAPTGLWSWTANVPLTACL